MKIAILSNTLNPHMKPLADEMYKMLGDDFKYIEGCKIEDERKAFGWGDSNKVPYLFNLTNDDHREECNKIISNYDAIVFGANPYMYRHIKKRISECKLTFLQTERIFKRSIMQILYPPRAYSFLQQRVLTSWKKNVYILATSAYLAWDYKRIGANTDRIYKFGYHVNKNQGGEINKKRLSKELTLMCLGRLVDLKHFDEAIRLLSMLVNSGYDAKLKIGGVGPAENKLKELARALSLENRVIFMGAIMSSDVKNFMESGDMFLFTSGFREGWGVTLNEAMACGCAIVASDAAGSTPWLIEDRKNGVIYRHGNIQSMYEKTIALLDDQDLVLRIRKNAYESIVNKWNATIAAERLIKSVADVLSGENVFFSEGIMSKAEVIKNNYY